MALYQLVNQRTKEIIDVYLVTNYNFDTEQSIIIYEAPGTNGGVSINAGRTNNTAAVNGKLFSKKKNLDECYIDLNNKIQRILTWKERGDVVKLKSPISDNSTQTFYIQKFHGDYAGGDGKTINFNITLTEYREGNVKQNSVNLVNYGPASFARELARLRAS